MAHRINDSVLGLVERPILAWLAQRMPQWVTPDLLTIIGVTGALIAATGFVLAGRAIPWLWLSCLGLAINWFGDSLDGTLARYRKIERPRYGFFVDHTSDLFCQVVIFLAFGLSPGMHFTVACLGLIVFLMAFIYTMIGTEVRDTMRITYAGFGPTEIRALFFAGNLFTLAFGVVDVGQWIGPLQALGPVSIHELVMTLLAVGGVTIIAGMAWVEGHALAIEDPSTVPRRRATDVKSPANSKVQSSKRPAAPEPPTASPLPLGTESKISVSALSPGRERTNAPLPLAGEPIDAPLPLAGDGSVRAIASTSTAK
jgi:phosphatidylglycerophosphate synthase